MKTNNKHGGARFKQRSDDKRGGARSGAGRPRRRFNFKSDFYTIVVHDRGIGAELITTWMLVSVSKNGFVLSSRDGKEVVTVREMQDTKSDGYRNDKHGLL